MKCRPLALLLSLSGGVLPKLKVLKWIIVHFPCFKTVSYFVSNITKMIAKYSSLEDWP